MSRLTPRGLKLVGLASVALAVVGFFASWSAMRSVEDGGVYITANVILFLAGAVALYVGYRPARR